MNPKRCIEKHIVQSVKERRAGASVADLLRAMPVPRALSVDVWLCSVPIRPSTWRTVRS